MEKVSLFWGLRYVFLTAICPGLFAWYVLPKLVDWNDVRWAGFPRGWEYK